MSSTYYLTTSGNNTFAYFQAMAAGDYTYVASGVNLFGGNLNGNGDGIYDTANGIVEIAGTLIGANTIYMTGATSTTTYFQVDAGGKVVTSYAGDYAFRLDNGAYNITNNGAISALISPNYSYGIYLGNNTASGTILNNGSINSAGFAIGDINLTRSNQDTIYNYGQIFGTAGAIYANQDVITIYNYGTIGSQDTWGYDSGKGGAITSLGSLNLYNYGQITGGVYCNYLGLLNNFGTIQGNVYLQTSGAGAGVSNSGTINGNVVLANYSDLKDSGTITGVVSLTSGSIELSNAQTLVSGGGDTVTFETGANNAVTLAGNAAWDNVLGSDGTVNLAGAYSGVVGGGDTVNFVGSTTDSASLWNTTNNWDTVNGANGTIYLSHAIASVVGAANTVNFTTGTDNIASLWNTANTFDSVNGSNNTVDLSDAYANVIGGGDMIDFTYGSANIASLFNTGGAADTVVNGAGSGTLYINNAQANVTGNGDTIDFTGAGTDIVTISGNNETFITQPISGAEQVLGFNSSDQIDLSAAQFGSSYAIFAANDITQAGGNTYIIDPSNHANVLVLVGVSATNLSASNVHFG